VTPEAAEQIADAQYLYQEGSSEPCAVSASMTSIFSDVLETSTALPND
jgi:hypothetical protein